MPLNVALQPGDPTEIAGYEIKGRVGAGGQGVVYLAVSQAGEQVAVKLLHPGLSGDPGSVSGFLREAQVAQRVAPFCTAQVLSTGIDGGRPYIISEYIEGPSLTQVIKENGPRTGGDLHRLAVSTVTALAAIHQAGIVHRDFKPSNVILAHDGPRVIDFGIARALDATATSMSSVIGTPPYMSPEQFLGEPVGPGSDLFSWASTMVYAATGTPPFGDDAAPAVLTRVLHSRPDVPPFEDPLREVVIACLAKDPAARPSLDEVIRRLLQQRGVAPSGPPGAASGSGTGSTALAPPPRPASAWRRRRTSVLTAVSVAVLITVVLVVPWGRLGTTSASSAPPSTSPSTSPSTATYTTRSLPGTRTTVYEYPDDAIRLAGYRVLGEGGGAYLRMPENGEFRRETDMMEALPSPDGRYVATRALNYDDEGFDSITILERSTGAKFSIRTVYQPMGAGMAGWSKDSSRILLNISKGEKDKTTYTGFAIIDVADRSIKKAVPNGGFVTSSAFLWDHETRGVTNEYYGGETTVFFGPDGKRTRDVPSVGPRSPHSWNIFSPAGLAFATECPDSEEHLTCIWATKTGKLLHEFSSKCDSVIGWYDETRLYCFSKTTPKASIQVVDFTGRSVRKLADTEDGFDVLDLIYARR